MKKSTFWSLLTLVMLVLVGCDSTTTTIDYLPCRVDKGDDWGFVNNRGEIFLADEFKHCPTAVIEGVFFVQEGELYSMYQFDEKKPKQLLEDLKYVGVPSNGYIPVCKKDCRIEIINTKGETVTTLETLDNMNVVSCEKRFVYGLLAVTVEDENENRYVGLVDAKGKMIMKPEYNNVTILGDNLCCVGKMKDGETEQFMVNKKGEKLKEWKNFDHCYSFQNYVVLERDDRCYIYNQNGTEVLKCSNKVNRIIRVGKNAFVYRGENQLGVMNLKGERILADKFVSIQIMNDGRFLVQKEYDDNYDIYSAKGEREESLDDDWEGVYLLEGFGSIGYDGDSYYILDKELEEIEKCELNDLGEGSVYGEIYSDYFDYTAVVTATRDALSSGLRNKGIVLEATPSDVPSIKSHGAEYLDSYTYSVTDTLQKGWKYVVTARMCFSERIVKPVYSTRTVSDYNWWYGYYNHEERYVSGYTFNPESKMWKIVLNCDVPYGKDERMQKELKRLLDAFAKKQSNYWVKDNLKYSLDDTAISIEPYIGEVYEVVEVEEAAMDEEEVVEAVEEVVEAVY